MPRMHDGRRRRSVEVHVYQRRDNKDDFCWTDGLSTVDRQQQAQPAQGPGGDDSHRQKATCTDPLSATPTLPITQEHQGSSNNRIPASRSHQKRKPRRKKRTNADLDSFSFGPPSKRNRKSANNANCASSISPSLASASTDRDDFSMVITPAASCCASVDSTSGTAAAGGATHLAGPQKQQGINSDNHQPQPKTGPEPWHSPLVQPPTTNTEPKQPPPPPSKSPTPNNNNDLVARLQRELLAVKERHGQELEQQEKKHKAEVEGWERKCQEKDNAMRDLQQQHEVSMEKQLQQHNSQMEQQQQEHKLEIEGWEKKCQERDAATEKLKKEHAEHHSQQHKQIQEWKAKCSDQDVVINHWKENGRKKDEQHAKVVESWQAKCAERDDTIRELKSAHEAGCKALAEQHAKDMAEAVDAERKRVTSQWEEDKHNLQQQLKAALDKLENLDHSEDTQAEFAKLQRSEAEHRAKLQQMSLCTMEMTQAQRALVKENGRQKTELKAERAKVKALEAQLQAKEDCPKEEKAASNNKQEDDISVQALKAASCLASLVKTTPSAAAAPPGSGIEIDLTQKQQQQAKAKKPRQKPKPAPAQPSGRSPVRRSTPRRNTTSSSNNKKGSLIGELEVVKVPRARSPSRRSSRKRSLPLPSFALLAKDLNLEKDIKKTTAKLVVRK